MLRLLRGETLDELSRELGVEDTGSLHGKTSWLTLENEIWRKVGEMGAAMPAPKRPK